MQYILSWLPVLACPVGMGLMMWFMMRGNKQQTPGEAGHTLMQTDSQPLEGTEPSGVAAPPKSAATFNLLGMSGNGNVAASQPSQMQGEQLPAVGLTRDEHLAALKSRMSSMQAEQEDLARQIAEVERPEVPVVSEAEAVAHAADERNRKRTTNRQK